MARFKCYNELELKVHSHYLPLVKRSLTHDTKSIQPVGTEWCNCVCVFSYLVRIMDTVVQLWVDIVIPELNSDLELESLSYSEEHRLLPFKKFDVYEWKLKMHYITLVFLSPFLYSNCEHRVHMYKVYRQLWKQEVL